MTPARARLKQKTQGRYGKMGAQIKNGPGGAGNTVNPGPNPCEGGAMGQSTHQHALYRFYGDDGALLYVGITNNPSGRFHKHGQTKSWWPEVRGITLEQYPDRPSVLAAESRAIEVERPRYNVQRPLTRKIRKARSHLAALPETEQKRCGHCWLCIAGDPICYVYANLEDDEDPIICGVCNKRDCLFGVGYDHGTQHGWTDGFDAGRRVQHANDLLTRFIDGRVRV